MSTLQETDTQESPDSTPFDHDLSRRVRDWLGTLERAPYTPPPVSIMDDLANGDLYIGTFGNTLALVFHGSLDFITRWYNWAVNTGTIGRNAQLNWYDRGSTSLAYVCPQNREVVLRGLALQFEAEMLRERAVTVAAIHDDETEELDVMWDAAHLRTLAAAKAEAFMRDHIAVDRVIIERAKSVAPIYDLSPVSRAEGRWGTGTEG